MLTLPICTQTVQVALSYKAFGPIAAAACAAHGSLCGHFSCASLVGGQCGHGDTMGRARTAHVGRSWCWALELPAGMRFLSQAARWLCQPICKPHSTSYSNKSAGEWRMKNGNWRRWVAGSRCPGARCGEGGAALTSGPGGATGGIIETLCITLHRHNVHLLPLYGN